MTGSDGHDVDPPGTVPGDGWDEGSDAEDEGDFPDNYFDPRCPFCNARSSRECPHLLATGSSGMNEWGIDPFGGPVPTITEALPPAQVEAFDGGWTAEQKSEAFGDLHGVLEAYASLGIFYAPRPSALLDALLPFLGTEVIERSHLDFVMGEFTADFCYFAADPDAARAELAALLVRLREAFVRLAALPVDPDLDESGVAPGW